MGTNAPHLYLWAALVALAFGPQPADAAVTEAWVHRYSNVVSNSVDQAVKVVRDAAGDVIVTGSTHDFITSAMLTFKYSGADGSVIWQQHYNSPANGATFASALTVDGSGNAVVIGSSRNDREDYDFYTAKYAAADGALLWEKRFNGPANGNDLVGGSRSLALGPNGMVVITGSSAVNFNSGFAYAYATVVYLEVLPPLSVELLPSGVRLSFIGTAGQSYSVQRAPAVSGPWTILGTQSAPPSGLIQYDDMTRLPGQDFYRTVQP